MLPDFLAALFSSKNRFFLRVLLYFLSLLIPLFMISTVYYVNFTEMSKRHAAEKVQQNLLYSSQNVDLYLRTIHETSKSLLQHQIIQKYLLPEELQTLREKPEMGEVIKAVARARSIIFQYTDQLFLIVDDRKVYLSDGAEEFHLFFNKFYKMDTYPAEYWKQKLKTRERHSFEILPATTVNSGNQTMIPLVTRDIVNGHDVIVTVTIPLRTIEETFKRNAIFPSTRYLIMNQYHQTVLGNTRDLSKLQDPRFEVASVDYNHYGWKYYAVTPAEDFIESSRSVIHFIVAVCAVLIFIGVITSIVYSVKIYNPIKKMGDILQTQNDQYRTISLEYLDNYVLNLLEGKHPEQTKTISDLLKKDLAFHGNRFLCCNILFHFHEAFYRDIQDVDRFNILNKLKNVISGLMKEFVKTYVTEYRPYLYVCVINLQDGEDRSRIWQALERLKKTFEYDFDYCRIHVGIGKVYRGLDHLSHSFSDAMTALEEREEAEQFQIVDSEDLRINHHYYYTFLDENQIINFLKVGDMRQLETKVAEIIRVNREKGVSHFYMNMLYSAIYNSGYKYAVERGMMDQDMISDGKMRLLFDQRELSLKDHRDKLQLLLGFFRKIASQPLRGQERKDDSLVSMIIRYVEENYMRDLYLEHIAERMGLSSKYVSRVFKEKTGMNLTDFISYIRISQAKRLLENTDWNIREIGEKVGIYSRTTFLRTFKKFEGISPLEYRQKNLKRVN